jgi:ectoine hydroxylase-related dioxygenase (phytanoyl-CoA dioxygenase family)
MLKKIEETLPIFCKQEFMQLVNKIDDPKFKSDILFFLENGYVIVNNSVPNEYIDDAVKEFVTWKNKNKSKFPQGFFKTGEMMDRIINIQANLSSFKKLFAYNSSLKHQDFLFQTKTSFYTSLFFEIGSAQDIHRDEPYFWTQPAHNYFGTWLAMEDTDETNGPLIVVPGSHRLGPDLIDKMKIVNEKYPDLENINSTDPDLWFNYQAELQKLCKKEGLEIIEVHVKKGDTIIWHPLLAHGGAQIKNENKTRMSFVVHTTPYDIPVYGLDVFYNPDKEVELTSGFVYEKINGRDVPLHGNLNVGHKEFDYSTLN